MIHYVGMPIMGVLTYMHYALFYCLARFFLGGGTDRH